MDEPERERVDINCCPCFAGFNEGKAFVTFVSFLIASIWFTFWVVVAIPWALWETTTGIIHLLAFNSSVLFVCYCYHKAITTPPGFSTHGWVPEGVSEAKLEEAKKRGKPGKKDLVPPDLPRWCAPCNSFKPPRAHHCKVLGRCVLRMDHFCPWIDNCVGFRNHKYFCLFLLYATIGLFDFLISFLYKIIADGLVDPKLIGPLEIIFLLWHITVTFPMTIMITALCSFQLTNTLANLTSIETRDYGNYRKYYRQHQVKFRWTYDQGLKANWMDFWGPNPGDWFIPTVPLHIQQSDGMSFIARPFYRPETEQQESFGVRVDGS